MNWGQAYKKLTDVWKALPDEDAVREPLGDALDMVWRRMTPEEQQLAPSGFPARDISTILAVQHKRLEELELLASIIVMRECQKKNPVFHYDSTIAPTAIGFTKSGELVFNNPVFAQGVLALMQGW